MDFARTGLTDQPLLRQAFAAGWAAYQDLFKDQTPETAEQRYLKGPVAMARLIIEHGGDCREVAAAACLAGPSVFCATPHYASSRMADFCTAIKSLEFASLSELRQALPQQNGDVRLFFQASAILLMEQLAEPKPLTPETVQDRNRSYADAFQLYNLARGEADVYKLDTRFEIAAMKVNLAPIGRQHIWAAQRPARAAAAPA